MTPENKQRLGYLLIGLGVAAWIPYFVLLLKGDDVSVAPFLIAHLIGVLSGSYFRSRARRELSMAAAHRTRLVIGRILIYLGVLAWAPYFAITRGGQMDVSVAPFLTAHLIGVLSGGALLVSGYVSKARAQDSDHQAG